MAEDRKLGANEAFCWQCGTVVYKGTKNCPKCMAPSPAISMATQRKVSLILLRVGLPVGIVSLIAGIIMFMNMLSSFEGLFEYIYTGSMSESTGFLLGGGLEIACLLLVIGISGILVSLIMYFSVKKRERQLSATRTTQ